MWTYIAIAIALIFCLLSCKGVYDIFKQGVNGGKWVEQNTRDNRFVEVRYKHYMGMVRGIGLIHDPAGTWSLTRVSYDTFKCREFEATHTHFPDEATARAAFALAGTL